MDGSVAGRTQLVIVALPTEDDQVRKFSSQKEPHLTLLYLGENKFSPEDIVHIAQYLEHAASLFPGFILDVERRGELGDNHADVLFFRKQWSTRVASFRDQLLRDSLIFKAYHSTDQFPDWSPHLTMGFPGTPAKKDTRDYPGFSYVNFDRVALWTGDSTGPTFPLKAHDYDLEVAMSQTEQGRSAMAGILEHHGVKGMKWGVHRDSPSGNSSSASPRASVDAKAAEKISSKFEKGGARALSNREMQDHLRRMDLEKRYFDSVNNHKSAIDVGQQNVQKLLKVGATVENVRRFMQTPTGKAVKVGLKHAFTAAKVAAAFKTGGASAAASKGASIVIKRTQNHYSNVGN